jgi:hypothetical protein
MDMEMTDNQIGCQKNNRDMFSAGGITMVVGILMALVFIIGSVYFVSKLFMNDTQEVLVRFILLVFTALVSLFIVDKVIAFKIKLVEDEQNKQLFDLIKTLTLMIFSYYFGTKKALSKDDNK